MCFVCRRPNYRKKMWKTSENLFWQVMRKVCGVAAQASLATQAHPSFRGLSPCQCITDLEYQSTIRRAVSLRASLTNFSSLSVTSPTQDPSWKDWHIVHKNGIQL